MTIKKLYTPAEVIEARTKIIGLSTDEMLSKGFVNLQAVLGHTSDYEVILTSHEGKPIQTIKEIRVLTGFSLAESKQLVDSLPSRILRELSQADALEAAARLRTAGAKAIARRAVAP